MASSVVADIAGSISTRVATTLPSYSTLDYLYDLSKNKFQKADSRYGVLPLDAIEVSGVTKFYTMDQRFRVILTTSYKTDQLSDSDRVTKIKTLMDYCHDIYKDLYDTRAGLNGTVLNVHEIAIDEPVILEGDKIVSVSMTFLITYRRQLGI